MAEAEYVTCPKCGGTGVINTNPNPATCDGPNWVMCERCQGTGKILEAGVECPAAPPTT